METDAPRPAFPRTHPLRGLMEDRREQLWSRLRTAGIPGVPDEFSVTFAHQAIPAAVLAEIDGFIRVFEDVTTRPVWQESVIGSSGQSLPLKRPEVCFFSAWDFHLPPEGPWQVIEFNDNGSGLLYAGLINECFHALLEPARQATLEAPLPAAELGRRIRQMVRQEAESFFGAMPEGLFLILDEPEALERGKFGAEMEMLRELFREEGWPAEVGTTAGLRWDGERLRHGGEPVSFIVNRSTDFLLEKEATRPLRDAFLNGGVYVAPNPFTYATRSDKRLLEFLSLPSWDRDLGIEARERDVLSRHIPETRLLRPDNLDAIVENRGQFVFKPSRSHASRGFLPSSRVGRSRLQRLVRRGEGYVAQRKVGRPQIHLAGDAYVWADLRVWAYRGERVLLSGRTSIDGDSLDLRPPAGWIPTFAAKAG